MRGGFLNPSLDGGLLLFVLFVSSWRRSSATLLAQRRVLRAQNLNLALKRSDQIANLLRAQNHSYVNLYFPTAVPKNPLPHANLPKHCGPADSPGLGVTRHFAISSFLTGLWRNKIVQTMCNWRVRSLDGRHRSRCRLGVEATMEEGTIFWMP